MSQEKPTKIFHLYFPIYNLRNPSNEIQVGYSNILKFESLPKQMQKDFVNFWESYYRLYTEYARSEEEYVRRKKTSTFLWLKFRLKKPKKDLWGGIKKTVGKGFKLANESASILSFQYLTYFPVQHCLFVSEDGIDLGSMGDYYFIPNLSICEYNSKFDAEISKLTQVLTKPKSQIDKKIRNALIIFGAQKQISNVKVRFVLLITCLESLLSMDDRDYLGWKLAERTAFLSKNRRIVNKGIREAYRKRSRYLHGNLKIKQNEKITKEDEMKIQGTVISILRKLMEFKEKGYVKIDEINEFVEKIKFK